MQNSSTPSSFYDLHPEKDRKFTDHYRIAPRDDMVRPEDNSTIEFTKALEELGIYLDLCDPPQWVFDRMEELNKEVDIMTDKALKDYQRIRSRTRGISLKLTQTEYDLLKAEADKESLPLSVFIRSKLLRHYTDILHHPQLGERNRVSKR